MRWSPCSRGAYSVEEEKDPQTVHFNKVGVTMEEHIGKHGWTGTKECLTHHTKKLNFILQSMKILKWIVTTIVAVDDGLQGIKTRAIRRLLPKPRQVCDEPEQGYLTVAILQCFFLAK